MATRLQKLTFELHHARMFEMNGTVFRGVRWREPSSVACLAAERPAYRALAACSAPEGAAP
jgi:hypothetical protein